MAVGIVSRRSGVRNPIEWPSRLHAGARLHSNRAPVSEEEHLVCTTPRAVPVEVAHYLATQAGRDRHPAELGALAASDLYEAALAVVLEVVDEHCAELGDTDPRSEQDLHRQPGPGTGRAVEDGVELSLGVGLHLHLRQLGGAQSKQGGIDRIALRVGPVGE